MVKVCSSGTEYLVIADNLNRKQAERIAEIITHALEEEQEESRFASSGIGTRNTIPCGRCKGLTVDDVYQQFGFEGLSLLLHCIPALLRNGMNVPEPEFLTVPYPFIVTLNKVTDVSHQRIIFGDVYIPVGDSYKQAFLDYVNARSL